MLFSSCSARIASEFLQIAEGAYLRAENAYLLGVSLLSGPASLGDPLPRPAHESLSGSSGADVFLGPRDRFLRPIGIMHLLQHLEPPRLGLCLLSGRQLGPEDLALLRVRFPDVRVQVVLAAVRLGGSLRPTELAVVSALPI